LDSYTEKLGALKIKLYRLHFLLTEEQTGQNLLDGLEQFKVCYKSAMECLQLFIKEEYKQQSKSYKDTLELALEHRLFNEGMIESMFKMAGDFEKAEKSKNNPEIYKAVQEDYARYLQMIFDMLIRMGEDPEEG
jgi:hypothetical protein